MLEAGVALARPPRGSGIDDVEVLEHGRHRGVHAVEVQAVESDFRFRGCAAVVVRPEPADEVDHVGVAPHPLGEALEASERLFGIGGVALAAHEAVDAVGVGPIGLHGDPDETLLANQTLRNLGSNAIKLVRAV